MAGRKFLPITEYTTHHLGFAPDQLPRDLWVASNAAADCIKYIQGTLTFISLGAEQSIRLFLTHLREQLPHYERAIHAVRDQLKPVAGGHVKFGAVIEANAHEAALGCYIWLEAVLWSAMANTDAFEVQPERVERWRRDLMADTDLVVTYKEKVREVVHMFSVKRLAPDLAAVLAEIRNEALEAARRLPSDVLAASSPKAGINAKGFLAPSDIADTEGVPLGALQKRLERWRKRNPDGSGRDWLENPDRASTQAMYLFRVGAVWHIVEDMKASTVRPAK